MAEAPTHRDVGVELATAAETRFCRGCQAENSPTVARCHNCGEAIGGRGQEAFDTGRRAARAWGCPCSPCSPRLCA